MTLFFRLQASLEHDCFKYAHQLQEKVEYHLSISHQHSSGATLIKTCTPGGLHDFVASSVLQGYAKKGLKVVDLGTGSGSMAERLRLLGCDVVGADQSSHGFQAQVPHVLIDFNRGDFASSLGEAKFDLVTSIEVIEHVENPISFLRNVRALLAPQGVAVITTPNVDSLPARMKHLLTGKIRMMDEYGDPTHITPIFADLLRQRFLPAAGLELRQHLFFPPNGFQQSRKIFSWPLQVAASVLSWPYLLGDHHVLVLAHPS